MTKQKSDDRLTPHQVLQLDAEELAEKHQQRLHQMTRQAVYGTTKKPSVNNFSAALSGSWFGISTISLAASAFSLTALVLTWQVLKQPETAPLSPSLANNNALPEWVQDADVPVAVIERIEFYQWLEKELKDEHKNSHPT